jgi:hypothetical protein
MAEGLRDRWTNFEPRKSTVAWSFVLGVVATLAVGFGAFDWQTAAGARAAALAAQSRERVELAEALCVERFTAAPNYAERLAELKETSRYSRDRFLEQGGWIDLAGWDAPVYAAADPCAERLLKSDATAPEPADVEES